MHALLASAAPGRQDLGQGKRCLCCTDLKPDLPAVSACASKSGGDIHAQHVRRLAEQQREQQELERQQQRAVQEAQQRQQREAEAAAAAAVEALRTRLTFQLQGTLAVTRQVHSTAVTS